MRRPSAALIISVLALVGAWSGFAIADALISSRNVRDNSLTTRDVKDRSLTGRDIRSNSLTGRVVGRLSGRDILADSLDGTDIDERSLGEVRRAMRADTADRADRAERSDSAARADTATSADRAGVADSVAGSRVQRVAFARGADAEATVLDLSGLRLRARCSSSNALSVVATTAASGTWIRVTGTMQRSNGDTIPVLARDDDFRPGDEFSVLQDGADNVAGQLVYFDPGGSTVTVTFMAEHAIAASRGFGCLFSGTAVQSG